MKASQLGGQIQRQNNKIKEKIEKLWIGFGESKTRHELKSLAIFLGLFSLATAGRVALQHVPSVEPIIPFAVLAGLVFGMREGFALGSGAYVASNFFVWGLHGPWTIFQALGGGISGLLGGMARVKGNTPGKDLIVLSLIGTIIFEVIMNISGAMLGIGLFLGLLAIPVYFLTSLPFSLAHIATNLGFAKLLEPLLKKLKMAEKNENELEIISISRNTPSGASTLRLYKYR